MKFLSSFFLSFFLFCSTLPATLNASDLIGKWAIKDSSPITVEYHDENTFRMNMNSESYVLMNKGKGYIVSQDNGEWVATSMDEMARMMEQSGIGKFFNRNQPQMGREERPKIENTGREENIAGIIGQVYLITTTNRHGVKETAEVVFANDSRLLTLQNAQARLAQSWGTMSQRHPGQTMGDLMKRYEENGPGGALLRYEDMMILKSINETNIDPNRFTVPRIQPVNMPDRGKMDNFRNAREKYQNRERDYRERDYRDRDPRDYRDREYRDSRDSRDYRDSRDRDYRDRDPRDSRDRDYRDSRDRDYRDARDQYRDRDRDYRDREYRDRDPRDYRDREYRDSRDRDYRDPRDRDYRDRDTRKSQDAKAQTNQEKEDASRLEKSTERVGDAAADQAEESVTEGVKDGVKDGVKSLFDGLFGR